MTLTTPMHRDEPTTARLNLRRFTAADGPALHDYLGRPDAIEPGQQPVAVDDERPIFLQVSEGRPDWQDAFHCAVLADEWPGPRSASVN